jgi:hypothetical protein
VPNTQVRLRDPSGRLLVHFRTAGAAKQTLAAAQAVQQLAENRHVGTSQDSGSDRQAPKFAGGWLVDLLHAAVHKSIMYIAE